MPTGTIARLLIDKGFGFIRDENGEVCGMTANSFVTVSLSPPTVLVSVMPGRMHRAISASGRYCVNVLPEQGRELSRHFASRPGAGVRIEVTIPLAEGGL